MKRLVLLLAVLALAGTALTTALASTDAAKKAICHRTSSATKPYVKLSVSAKTLKTHLKHVADIFPVPAGGCPKTLLATTGGTPFKVTMTGQAESPAGDPVRKRTAVIRPPLGQAQACLQPTATNPPA